MAKHNRGHRRQRLVAVRDLVRTVVALLSAHNRHMPIVGVESCPAARLGHQLTALFTHACAEGCAACGR